MQINGYCDTISPYNLRTQSTAKSNETFELQATKNAAITETKQLTEAEEMEVFKKEIQKEISEIYKGTSSIILSNSVHITDGTFKRMKAEPEFKNKMMKVLREDAIASHQLPYKVNITTTIDENGYSSYGANVYPHDNAKTKADKKADADKKAEDAFYYSSSYKREFSQKKTDFDEIWLQNKAVTIKALVISKSE